MEKLAEQAQLGIGSLQTQLNKANVKAQQYKAMGMKDTSYNHRATTFFDYVKNDAVWVENALEQLMLIKTTEKSEPPETLRSLRGQLSTMISDCKTKTDQLKDNCKKQKQVFEA